MSTRLDDTTLIAEAFKDLKRDHEDLEDDELTSQGKKRRRSRKGLEKQHECDEPGCGKKFTRLEHLSRHQLNHRPKEIFRCTWPDCKKTFVREDLKIRHIERHERRQASINGKGHSRGRSKSNQSEEGNRYDQATVSPTMTSSSMTPGKHHSFDIDYSSNLGVAYGERSSGTTTATSAHTGPMYGFDSYSPMASHNNRDSYPRYGGRKGSEVYMTSASPDTLTGAYSMTIGRPISDLRNTALLSEGAMLIPEHGSSSVHHNGAANSHAATDATVHSNTINPATTTTITNNATSVVATTTNGATVDGGAEDTNTNDLISWLFSEDMMSNAKDPLLSPSFYSFDSPMSLHSLLSPPSTHEEITMSESKRQELMRIINVESHDAATLGAFQTYVAKFWAYVHPQYPILHRPSFQADKCPPGLLWAIVLLGAAIDKQHDLAYKIAEPLRWHLFGSRDFHPPAKLWVIQSLVFLELYEKTMTDRREHERAHIHHATTLQLLRRGSVLRGMESPRESDPWKRWIETEAAKRVALMAFVLDVFDATMFGHAMVMSVHEIRLSLPCSEAIWAEFPSEKGIPRLQNTPVLMALKKMLNKTHVDTGPFGRRVLLSGLLCLAHQMQQRDLQVNSLGWGQFKDTWRDTLGPAYNFWKKDYDLSVHGDSEDNHGLPIGSEASNYSYTMELQGCTSSFYHLAHMSMMITFLDAQVYAGAPATLNQPIRQVDHENSVRRINEWAVSVWGRRAFWHAIQFLKEMYLVTHTRQEPHSLYYATCDCPDQTICEHSYRNEDPIPLSKMIKVEYDAYNDPVVKRPNAVYLSALIVWAFSYCLEGPETTILADSESAIEQDIRALSGTATLANTGRLDLNPEAAIATIESETNDIASAEDGYEYLHRLANMPVDEIGKATNKKNTVGLLRMVVHSIKFHHAELVQEGRRLLVHCIDRSLGRNKVRCEYMFKRHL
ncbi:hypothetical protein TRVA0_047S01046 [Trichomonascus vanleenenianus]|uniref:Sdd4p n=1 Tax=Trichomonascus vanleenenianus TaxID=2268995 RepID=UPI003ECB5A11